MYTVLYMAATRTQIYLTEEQRARIDALRGREGKSLAQIMREALDSYLDGQPGVDRQQSLKATFGSMPDLEVPSRDEWDRA